MRYVCSLITVSDIEKSKQFYTEILNQKIEMDHGENVLFEGGFAIHLKSHFERLTNKMAVQKSNNFELYFEEDDLDTLFEILKQCNVEFLHAIQEQPWKQRVMRFYDPDFHIIEVGESMENVCIRLVQAGLSVQEIHSKTGMPVDFIERATR